MCLTHGLLLLKMKSFLHTPSPSSLPAFRSVFWWFTQEVLLEVQQQLTLKALKPSLQMEASKDVSETEDVADCLN